MDTREYEDIQSTILETMKMLGHTLAHLERTKIADETAIYQVRNCARGAASLAKIVHDAAASEVVMLEMRHAAADDDDITTRDAATWSPDTCDA